MDTVPNSNTPWEERNQPHAPAQNWKFPHAAPDVYTPLSPEKPQSHRENRLLIIAPLAILALPVTIAVYNLLSLNHIPSASNTPITENFNDSHLQSIDQRITLQDSSPEVAKTMPQNQTPSPIENHGAVVSSPMPIAPSELKNNSNNLTQGAPDPLAPPLPAPSRSEIDTSNRGPLVAFKTGQTPIEFPKIHSKFQFFQGQHQEDSSYGSITGLVKTMKQNQTPRLTKSQNATANTPLSSSLMPIAPSELKDNSNNLAQGSPAPLAPLSPAPSRNSFSEIDANNKGPLVAFKTGESPIEFPNLHAGFQFSQGLHQEVPSYNSLTALIRSLHDLSGGVNKDGYGFIAGSIQSLPVGNSASCPFCQGSAMSSSLGNLPQGAPYHGPPPVEIALLPCSHIGDYRYAIVNLLGIDLPAMIVNGISQSGDSLDWNIGTLAPGQTIVVASPNPIVYFGEAWVRFTSEPGKL